ncbi:hypothetical protein EOPP23_11755 [Endozoicomonas sp. OPT23]|uniref:hypothetical protein n=1 Tax=Endozoicomonas sp. OPT23 TaxID=2072845 RepID=UPI00129A4B21|nr:hypothetical protein [Endozoicomonas sp. OPT23]MRI33660.1 hypothetical protein [Endozoicomonas sp. OPT23]
MDSRPLSSAYLHSFTKAPETKGPDVKLPPIVKTGHSEVNRARVDHPQTAQALRSRAVRLSVKESNFTHAVQSKKLTDASTLLHQSILPNTEELTDVQKSLIGPSIQEYLLLQLAEMKKGDNLLLLELENTVCFCRFRKFLTAEFHRQFQSELDSKVKLLNGDPDKQLLPDSFSFKYPATGVSIDMLQQLIRHLTENVSEMTFIDRNKLIQKINRTVYVILDKEFFAQSRIAGLHLALPTEKLDEFIHVLKPLLTSPVYLDEINRMKLEELEQRAKEEKDPNKRLSLMLGAAEDAMARGSDPNSFLEEAKSLLRQGRFDVDHHLPRIKKLESDVSVWNSWHKEVTKLAEAVSQQDWLYVTAYTNLHEAPICFERSIQKSLKSAFDQLYGTCRQALQHPPSCKGELKTETDHLQWLCHELRSSTLNRKLYELQQRLNAWQKMPELIKQYDTKFKQYSAGSLLKTGWLQKQVLPCAEALSANNKQTLFRLLRLTLRQLQNHLTLNNLKHESPSSLHSKARDIQSILICFGLDDRSVEVIRKAALRNNYTVSELSKISQSDNSREALLHTLNTLYECAPSEHICPSYKTSYKQQLNNVLHHIYTHKMYKRYLLIKHLTPQLITLYQKLQQCSKINTSCKQFCDELLGILERHTPECRVQGVK